MTGKTVSRSFHDVSKRSVGDNDNGFTEHLESIQIVDTAFPVILLLVRIVLVVFAHRRNHTCVQRPPRARAPRRLRCFPFCRVATLPHIHIEFARANVSPTGGSSFGRAAAVVLLVFVALGLLALVRVSGNPWDGGGSGRVTRRCTGAGGRRGGACPSCLFLALGAGSNTCAEVIDCVGLIQY